MDGLGLVRLAPVEGVVLALRVDERLAVGRALADDHHALVAERHAKGPVGIGDDRLLAQLRRRRAASERRMAGRGPESRGGAGVLQESGRGERGGPRFSNVALGTEVWTSGEHGGGRRAVGVVDGRGGATEFARDRSADGGGSVWAEKNE